jgi:ADP-ribose pyrophosphatase YjhB (NUDIX family)
MIRAQCIVVRGRQILMVKHRHEGEEWWCLPGGGVEAGETAAAAALRELKEECCVLGNILFQTSAYTDYFRNETVTFLVDIAGQEPRMGNDPEFAEERQILVDLRWLSLKEISERDRAYLWAAGLLCVPDFLDEVYYWGDTVSYPDKKSKV